MSDTPLKNIALLIDADNTTLWRHQVGQPSATSPDTASAAAHPLLLRGITGNVRRAEQALSSCSEIDKTSCLDVTVGLLHPVRLDTDPV